MLKLINLDTPIDVSLLSPVRWSEAVTEAFLRTFIGSADAVSGRFVLDAAGKQSFARAIAKVAGMPRDKTTTFTQVAVVANGKTSWTRLKKGESAGRRETREASIKSYTRDTLRAAEAVLRDTTGVSWKLDETVSSPVTGTSVYVLVREATVSGENTK